MLCKMSLEKNIWMIQPILILDVNVISNTFPELLEHWDSRALSMFPISDPVQTEQNIN